MSESVCLVTTGMERGSNIKILLSTLYAYSVVQRILNKSKAGLGYETSSYFDKVVVMPWSFITFKSTTYSLYG